MIKEIAVASGKGGTGKTFISSNLAYFIRKKLGEVIAVDADVEAPDLILALGGEKSRISAEEYYGSYRPVIDYTKCTKCWKCVNFCKFGAITIGEKGPVVDYSKCEGLGACAVICPAQAISLKEAKTGVIYVAESAFGIKVVTGDLELGGGTSGRLVYELKKLARSFLNSGYVIVDSAPGIGCPVVSSISGADLLVIVVEPTPQSVKGSQRLLKVAETLGVKSVCIVNKYDINPDFSAKIGDLLGIEVVGKVPYSRDIVESYSMMTPLLATKSSLKPLLENAFEKILDIVSK
ncbi:MAG: (4Fe-4S)-binding protein [Thermoprotei archaeon]|nr:MAG: (4Fe-4S)-binding protein [Thermoprotei archaeon]